MSTTGFAIFDRTIQKTNLWLREAGQVVFTLPEDLRGLWPSEVVA